MNRARRGARARAGFALPGALIALVLLSALVVGTLFVSTEEARAGRGSIADQRALSAAEWALARAIARWNVLQNMALLLGNPTIVPIIGSSPNDSVTVVATRVGPTAIWLTATARVGGDGRSTAARRSIGASLRLVGATVPRQAALTTPGGVIVDGGLVDGEDASVSDSAGVCRESGPAAGVALPDVARVTCVTCVADATTGVFGSPAIDSNVVVDSAFPTMGEETVAALSQRASIVLDAGSYAPRPTASNGVCDITDPLNWGDVTDGSPCSDWYPVVWVRGGAVLTGGARGQGILLVDGDLRVETNAQFVGVVVASGRIDVVGPGAVVVGATFAGRSATDVSAVRDGGAVRFSRCAIRRAEIGTARLAPTAERWWVELR